MNQSGKTVVFADLTGSTRLYEAVGNLAAAGIVTRCTQAVGAHLETAGGKVVKYLGDGVLTLFGDAVAAVEASMRIPDILASLHLDELKNTPVGFKIGIEYGSLIEQNGDYYGDAVNVAARLSDRAETGEVLVGEGAFSRLPKELQFGSHSLDRITVRGRTEPVRVWRIDWGRTAESTLSMPLSLLETNAFEGTSLQELKVCYLDQEIYLHPEEPALIIGRNPRSSIHVNDPRVSRRHALLEWSNNQFLLTDFSSNGTWVRFSSAQKAVTLKRESCILHGAGEIGLGRSTEILTAPTLTFQVVD